MNDKFPNPIEPSVSPKAWLAYSPASSDLQEAAECFALIAAYQKRYGSEEDALDARAECDFAIRKLEEKLGKRVSVEVEEDAKVPPECVIEVWRAQLDAEIERTRAAASTNRAKTWKSASPELRRNCFISEQSSLRERAKIARRRALRSRRRVEKLTSAALPSAHVHSARFSGQHRRSPGCSSTPCAGSRRGADGRSSKRSGDGPSDSDGPGGDDPPQPAGDDAEPPNTGPGAPCFHCGEPIPEFKPGAKRRTKKTAEFCSAKCGVYYRRERDRAELKVPPTLPTLWAAEERAQRDTDRAMPIGRTGWAGHPYLGPPELYDIERLMSEPIDGPLAVIA